MEKCGNIVIYHLIAVTMAMQKRIWEEVLMKRSKAALLALFMMLCIMFVLPACAETVLKDGIEVTLTTDKESYVSSELINADLSVNNTNSYPIKNVRTKILAPDGYKLLDDGETRMGEMAGGSVKKAQSVMSAHTKSLRRIINIIFSELIKISPMLIM